MKITEKDYRKNIEGILSCIKDHIENMNDLNKLNSFFRLNNEFYSLNEDVIKLKHRMKRLQKFKGKKEVK